MSQHVHAGNLSRVARLLPDGGMRYALVLPRHEADMMERVIRRSMVLTQRAGLWIVASFKGGFGMQQQQHTQEQLTALADMVADDLNADVLLLVSSLNTDCADTVTTLCAARRRRQGVFALLTTSGGDADAAYRIGRALQRYYEDVTVAVYGYCKSAGSLVALASDCLAMSDLAELGPLDVQILKRDELGERSSGLTISQALDTLRAESFDLFEDHFLNLIQRSRGQVSTRRAAEMASQHVTGLFGQVYAQIDPVQLGENQRALEIARRYGTVLVQSKRNVSEEGLDKLVEKYPTHSFVIDREQAQDIFLNVRGFTDKEQALAALLAPLIRFPQDGCVIEFLNTEVPENQHDQAAVKPDQTSGEGTEPGNAGSGASSDGTADHSC